MGKGNALEQLGFKSLVDYRLYDNSDGNGEQIEWLSDQTQPSDAEIAVGQAEYDAQEYARKRKEAYDAAGCTIAALTVATFESVFDDDSSAAVRLQVLREKIKAAIPKT